MPQQLKTEKTILAVCALFFLFTFCSILPLKTTQFHYIIALSAGLTLFIMLLSYFLFLAGGIIFSARIPGFSSFLKSSGLFPNDFMFNKGIYISDPFLWLCFFSGSCNLLAAERNANIYLFSIIFMPVYAVCSVWIYAVKKTGNPSAALDTGQKAAVQKIVWPQSVSAQDLKKTSEKLKTFIILLDNKTLAENTEKITRTLDMIADFIISTEDVQKYVECLRKTSFYAEEFYNMIMYYDEISPKCFCTKESERLKTSIESFAQELKTALIRIFETASTPELLENKSRIDALHKEMRMKGLIE